MGAVIQPNGEYGYIDLTEDSYSFVKPESSFSPTNVEFKTNKMLFRLVKGNEKNLTRSILLGNEDENFYATEYADYWISVFPVTQRQWELVRYEMPFTPEGRTRGDEKPMVFVSYNKIRGSKGGAKWPETNYVDMDSFIGSFRMRSPNLGMTADLPTEAEWEIACRAGSSTKFFCGDSIGSEYAWFDQDVPTESDSDCDTIHDVGLLDPNPLGLYDMSGNVFEWCLDWYGPYPDGTSKFSTKMNYRGASEGTERVLRGGSWNVAADYLASSYRGHITPNRNGIIAGFRLVLK